MKQAMAIKREEIEAEIAELQGWVANYADKIRDLEVELRETESPEAEVLNKGH